MMFIKKTIIKTIGRYGYILYMYIKYIHSVLHSNRNIEYFSRMSLDRDENFFIMIGMYTSAHFFFQFFILLSVRMLKETYIFYSII